MAHILGEGLASVGAALLFMGFHAAVLTVGLSVAHAGCFGRIPTRYWLPIMWTVCEAARASITQISADDWLCTQWQNPWVLDALATLGWWPTSLICLFGASAFGELLASGRVRPRLQPFLAVIASVLFLALVPARPVANDAPLEGLGVVHMTNTLDRPVSIPPTVELVVWPEVAYENERPRLFEGPDQKGARIEPPAPTAHLIGVSAQAPGVGLYNALVTAQPDGRLQSARAKRVLLPFGERRMLGLGTDTFVAGRIAPVLRFVGREFIGLICGELMNRSLIREGLLGLNDPRVSVLAVASRDTLFRDSPSAFQQMLAVQVLRSAEFGVPSVRASLNGPATIVASDGRVLATSVVGRNGVLTWSANAGPVDYDFFGKPIEQSVPARRDADIAVLYSEAAASLRAPCPEGRCAYFPIEEFECPGRAMKTIIVSGHAAPPSFIQHGPADVAAAIRCFSPELVVIDTCFGASLALLEPLADLDAVVVAAPFRLPLEGFRLDPVVFSDAPAMTRAAGVRTDPARPLLRQKLDAEHLRQARSLVEAMDADALDRAVISRAPLLIEVPMPGPRILARIDADRLRGDGAEKRLERRLKRLIRKHHGHGK